MDEVNSRRLHPPLIVKIPSLPYVKKNFIFKNRLPEQSNLSIEPRHSLTLDGQFDAKVGGNAALIFGGQNFDLLLSFFRDKTQDCRICRNCLDQKR